ncbi:MAG: FMN-dependent NADH-azoreductase [bacterium ADurb.Bin429]|nr:MAG: FMN-dependent NADH-azoreductase [bacterium ADurb.Bin429]
MATLLHILAHPHPEASQTTRISNAFLEAYRAAHPGDTVEEVSLFQEPVSYLSATHLAAMSKHEHPDTMTPEEAGAWQEILGYLDLFCAADNYLVTAPMWNLGVPAVLKAYIDQILQPGYTFRYTGPGMAEGLCIGKHMVIISSRGGVYSMPVMREMEMCVRYLRAIFGFIGIEIVDELVAEGLAIVGARQQDEILTPLLARAGELGRTFDGREFKQAA